MSRFTHVTVSRAMPRHLPTRRLSQHLVIVLSMQTRAWISSSKWGRVACLALLVLFALVCGIHFAGAHHDGDADGLGLTDAFSLISIVVMVMMLGASSAPVSASIRAPRAAIAFSNLELFESDPQPSFRGAPSAVDPSASSPCIESGVEVRMDLLFGVLAVAASIVVLIRFTRARSRREQEALLTLGGMVREQETPRTDEEMERNA